MKNYLALARTQAKVHRRRNRLTIFCIALAVFLVTGVFSMADFAGRDYLRQRAAERHGSWHICLKDVPEAEAEEVRSAPNVEASTWYDELNYHLEKDYFLQGKPVIVCGVEAGMLDIACNQSEGAFPSELFEIEVTENLRDQFSLKIGDAVTVQTPAGAFEYVISGFLQDTNALLEDDCAGVYMNRAAFSRFCAANGEQEHPMLFIRFTPDTRLQKTITALRETHGWTGANLSENAAVLGAEGQSSNDYILGIYGVAAVLMLLVVLAGVLMISGSMNSNVAERTQYFGLLRCVGAGKRQVKRLVRREALNWCRIAIPLGEVAAVLGAWGICALLHYGIGGEWAAFPVFKISFIGLAVGIVIGVVTVLLAANAPARRAAAVSPIEAVAGSRDSAARGRIAEKRLFRRADTAMGTHHALSGRKSLFMMTGSFALSIILFLSFSVMIDWIGHALNTTKPYSQDLSVYYDDYRPEIPHGLAEELQSVPGIRSSYGRMYSREAVSSSKPVSEVDFISYEDLMFSWAEKELLTGSIRSVQSGSGVMTVHTKSNPLTLGDRLTLAGTELEVTAVLSDSPFSDDGIPVLICSEQTFSSLVGRTEYSVIDLQVEKGDSDPAVAVRALLPEGCRLGDHRAAKQEINNTYTAFCLLVYGFLAIVALITVFNIINSISLSASSRYRQFGIMRSLGMDLSQLRRMISAEAVTYAVSGCVAGCAVGFPLNAWLHNMIIGHYWGDPWKIPWPELTVILLVVLLSAVLAVRRPLKRIAAQTITEAITAQ